MLLTLFCCPACHQGLVIIQDVSGNRTNCYEIIIAMNLTGIGERIYSWGYLPATPHAKSFPRASCQEHILVQIVTFRVSFLHSIRFLCAPAHGGVLAINYTFVPPSHGTFPVSYLSPSLQSLSPVSREKWGVILFSWEDTWFMTCGFCCLGVAVQNRSNFRGQCGMCEEGKSGKSCLFYVFFNFS